MGFGRNRTSYVRAWDMGMGLHAVGKKIDATCTAVCSSTIACIYQKSIKYTTIILGEI